MIPRPHGFIHQLDPAASTQIKVPFCIFSASSTRPTKFVFAEAAGHVIAAFILLDSRAAHGTKGYVSFVFFRPTFELPTHCLLTSDQLAVPKITALEANLCCALWTHKFIDFFAGGANG